MYSGHRKQQLGCRKQRDLRNLCRQQERPLSQLWTLPIAIDFRVGQRSNIAMCIMMISKSTSIARTLLGKGSPFEDKFGMA
jgi:hypothetical protein